MRNNILALGMGLLLSSNVFAQWVDPGNDNTGNIYYENGNVGIGTTDPTEKLHVDGNIIANGQNLYLGGNLLNSDNSGHIYSRSNHSQISGFALKDKEGTTYGRLYGNNDGAYFGLLDGDSDWSLFIARNNYTSFLIDNDEKMRIQSDGNVGIGTSAPGEKLSIVGRTSSKTGYLLDIEEDRGTNYTGGFASKALSFSYGDSVMAGVGVMGSSTNSVGVPNYFYINVGPKNHNDYSQPQMVVKANGRIGIGMTNPRSPLTVSGIIESTSGGFRFPDGTIQSTAATGGSGSIVHSATQNIQLNNHWLSGDGGNEGVFVASSGNVGIGTTAPNEKLEVNGSVLITNRHLYLGGNLISSNNGSYINLYSNNNTASGVIFYDNESTAYGRVVGLSAGTVFGLQDADGDWSYRATKDNYTAFYIGGQEKMRIQNDGHIGIGTTGASSPLTVSGMIESTTGGIKFPDGTVQTTAATGSGGSNVWSKTGTDASFDGNVGIGTTDPQHALDVVGTIRTCEVKVSNLQGWCDYVFEEDYQLPALDEVETYIKTNKHLMDIPSEAEVMENGISLGEMDAALLKKVEELTLYMIELKKENNALLERIEKMETK